MFEAFQLGKSEEKNPKLFTSVAHPTKQTMMDQSHRVALITF